MPGIGGAGQGVDPRLAAARYKMGGAKPAVGSQRPAPGAGLPGGPSNGRHAA